jgi:nitroimidazol reductase NimA-like FMN-containing flavoprotein (pyridoxamine 5'-phosphate oxidase superfamily)
MQDMTAQEIERLLRNARIGRLCMADAAGRPYTIPLPFCWTRGSLYLRLPLSGRKGLVLTQNDQVCFELDEFTETLDEYASVLVEGRLVAVVDLDEKAQVKRCNDAKYARLRHGHRPGHRRSSPLEQLPLRRIVVERISGRKKEATPQEADLMIVGQAGPGSTSSLKAS